MRKSRQGLLAIFAATSAAAMLASCGSFDTKEPTGSVHQSFECTGAQSCTEAESYANLSCYDTKLGITLVCYECVIVESKAVGMFDNPACNPHPADAGVGGAAGEAGAAGAAGSTGGASGTGGTSTGGAAGEAGAAGAAGTGGTGGTGGSSTGGAAGEAGAAGAAGSTGGSSGTGGTSTGGAAGEAGAAGAAGSTGGTGGSSTGGAAGEAGAAGAAGSTGGSSGTGGTSTGGAAGEAGAAGAAGTGGTACVEQIGTPCANTLAYACDNTLRCSCTGIWSDPATTDLYICGCKGGQLCTNFGWNDGFTCTEPIPNSDSGSWTLKCQCGVMLQENSGVVCVDAGAGGSSGTGGTGGSSTGGAAGAAGAAGTGGVSGTGGTSTGGAAGAAGTGGAGGTGGTSTGGAAGAAGAAGSTGGASGTGGTAGSGGSLINPSTLPEDKCKQVDEVVSSATLPVTGLWLQYTAPSHGAGTFVAEYDWTDFFVPGNTDTMWQIRTVAPNTVANDIFIALRNDTSYARYFQPKVVAQETVGDCHLFHNDGYFCSATDQDALKDTVYCLGTWTIWNNGIKGVTFTDAPSTTPALPFIKTIQKIDGFWSPKIGYLHP